MFRCFKMDFLCRTPSISVLPVLLLSLFLTLLFCSLIFIATADCRRCPYDTLAQQMVQNIPWNIPSTIKKPIQANGRTLAHKVAIRHEELICGDIFKIKRTTSRVSLSIYLPICLSVFKGKSKWLMHICSCSCICTTSSWSKNQLVDVTKDMIWWWVFTTFKSQGQTVLSLTHLPALWPWLVALFWQLYWSALWLFSYCMNELFFFSFLGLPFYKPEWWEALRKRGSMINVENIWKLGFSVWVIAFSCSHR